VIRPKGDESRIASTCDAYVIDQSELPCSPKLFIILESFQCGGKTVGAKQVATCHIDTSEAHRVFRDQADFALGIHPNQVQETEDRQDLVLSEIGFYQYSLFGVFIIETYVDRSQCSCEARIELANPPVNHAERYTEPVSVELDDGNLLVDLAGYMVKVF
jgi:hypothetical protein